MRSPELTENGKPTGRSIIQDVDTDLDREWYEMMKGVLAPEIFGETETTKGGPLSGNWGHRGRPGKVGGSARESQSYLPKMRPTHPRQDDKAKKIMAERIEKRRQEEYRKITHGEHPRNERTGMTLAEAEARIVENNLGYEEIDGRRINELDSPGRAYLLHKTGAKKVWFGEGKDELWYDRIMGHNEFGSTLTLEDENGAQLKAIFVRGEPGFELSGLFKHPAKGVLGLKFMRAMKDLSDLTGRNFEVVMVANYRYFDHFKWLKKVGFNHYVYDPKGES